MRICIMIYVVVQTFVLSLTSFILAAGDLPVCAKPYPQIAFHYTDWLIADGMLNMYFCGIWLVTVLDDTAPWPYYLSTLLKYIWFIVGAVLFFMTLPPSDCNTTSLWRFGLTLFVFEGCSFISMPFMTRTVLEEDPLQVVKV